MTRLDLRRWNGRFDQKGVVETIRRKIRGRIQGNHCVLIDMEDVVGFSPQALSRLTEGWPENHVKFCGCTEMLPFPLPIGVRPSFASNPMENRA